MVASAFSLWHVSLLLSVDSERLLGAEEAATWWGHLRIAGVSVRASLALGWGWTGTCNTKLNPVFRKDQETGSSGVLFLYMLGDIFHFQISACLWKLVWHISVTVGTRTLDIITLTV